MIESRDPVSLTQRYVQGRGDELQGWFVKVPEIFLDGVQSFDQGVWANPCRRMVPVTIRQRLSSEGSGSGFGEKGFDEHHLAALLELEGDWPPITIWGPKRMVIDGNYRVAAARRLGLAKLMAWTFSGSESDAFVESLRLNAAHGLPLTQEERLRVSHQGSERPSGLVRSANRGGLRCLFRNCGQGTGSTGSRGSCVPIHSVRRIGLDGRARPLNPAATASVLWKR